MKLLFPHWKASFWEDSDETTTTKINIKNQNNDGEDEKSEYVTYDDEYNEMIRRTNFPNVNTTNDLSCLNHRKTKSIYERGNDGYLKGLETSPFIRLMASCMVWASIPSLCNLLSFGKSKESYKCCGRYGNNHDDESDMRLSAWTWTPVVVSLRWMRKYCT